MFLSTSTLGITTLTIAVKMNPIFDNCYSTVDLFPNFFDKILFNYLVMTCTVIIDSWSPKIFDKTTGLGLFNFFFSYIYNGISTNDEII